MIVRDEEEMLPRCLAAVAPAVDEIVIVDTGSVDRTVEIAHEFGARVIHREWTGSFSEARNVSFEAATGDWLMYLDADEVLVADDVKRLRALTGRIWKEAFYLVETSYTGDVEDGSAVTNSALRIFRNRPHYRFEGRLHEQIAHHLPTYAHNRIEQTSVRVEHFGYLGAVRDAKEKSTRNVELLRAQQRESAPSAFLHFNIGTEYAVIGDHGSALIEFERAFEMARRQGEERRDYVPALMTRLVTALRLTGRQTEAVAKVEEGLELFPGFTDLVYAQALAYVSIDRFDEAIEAWKRCIEMGDAPARYGATVGAGTYLPKISLAELYLNRGEIQQATELLDECITEFPGFVGVVGPYATALIAGGATPDAVVSEIESRVAEVTLAVRFVLGTVLYARGAMAAAERQYREVLAGRPSSSQVRVALAEALLHQRRYVDAAIEAGAVPGDDAFAPLAARIELWGSLAGEDLARATAAQAKAAAVGVPASQLEVFDAWASLLGPQPGPAPAARRGRPAARRDPRDTAEHTGLQDFRAARRTDRALGPARARAARDARVHVPAGWPPAPGRSGVDGDLRVGAGRARARRPGPRVGRAWRRRGRRRVRDRSLEPGAHQRSGPGDPGPLCDRRRRVITGGLTKSTHGDIEQTCNTSLKLSMRRPITAPEPEYESRSQR